MLCALSVINLPTLFQDNGTCIVLVQTIIFDILDFRSNEVPGPTDFCHEVINAHNFCLFRYFFASI